MLPKQSSWGVRSNHNPYGSTLANIKTPGNAVIIPVFTTLCNFLYLTLWSCNLLILCLGIASQIYNCNLVHSENTVWKHFQSIMKINSNIYASWAISKYFLTLNMILQCSDSVNQAGIRIITTYKRQAQEVRNLLKDLLLLCSLQNSNPWLLILVILHSMSVLSVKKPVSDWPFLTGSGEKWAHGFQRLGQGQALVWEK